MSVTAYLASAQNFVEQQNDGTDFFFNQYYTAAREYNGVRDSVDAALRALDLYDSFQVELDEKSVLI